MLPTARPMESAARVLTEKALTVVEMVRAARTKEVVIWKRILGGFVGRSYVKSFVEGKYIRWKACSPIIVIALVIERRAVRKGRRELQDSTWRQEYAKSIRYLETEENI